MKEMLGVSLLIAAIVTALALTGRIAAWPMAVDRVCTVLVAIAVLIVEQARRHV